MADGTVTGRFELDAEQPIRSLHSIRDAGVEADNRLESLGRSLDDIGRKSPRASVGLSGYDESRRQLDDLGGRLDTFSRKRASAHVGLSGFDRANAQLTELEARLDRLDARRVSPHVGIGGGFSGAGAGGGGGGGGTPLLSSLGGVGGALPWWAAAVPFAPQLLGGAGALVGSAGSAALGAGVVGLGGAGALLGGMGSIATVRESIKSLTGVTAAQTKYNDAVKAFGAASSQATTAKRNLDLALANAPPGAAGAARQFALLGQDWRQAIAPGQRSLYGSLAQGTYALRGAIPQLAPYTNAATGQIGMQGANFARFLVNPQSIASERTLIQSFTNDLPLVEGTLQNITRTFLNLSTTAQPFFREGLAWVDQWTAGLARSSGDTARVSSDMQGMVTSARAWGGLLVSAEHVLRDLFSPGVQPGNSMVGELTNTLDHWDTWLRDNPQKVQQFFQQGVQGTSRIASILGNLTHDVWQLFQYLQPIFTRAEQFLKFASGLGGGNLALGGGLLYGGYRGVTGALGRGPSAGSLLSSVILGPGIGGLRGRGAAGGLTQAEATMATTTAEVSAVERSGLASTATNLYSAVRGLPVIGGVANRVPIGAFSTAARGLDVLGAGLRGAAEIAAPILAINGLITAMGTRGGPIQKLSGFIHGASGGIVPATVAGGTPIAAPVVGGGASLAAMGGSRLLSTVTSGGMDLATGALATAASVPGAYAGLMAFPELAGGTQGGKMLNTQTKAFASQLTNATTPAAALAASTAAHKWWNDFGSTLVGDIPSNDIAGERRAMDQWFSKFGKDAAAKAGVISAGNWTSAFSDGVAQGKSPQRAVKMMLGGMVSQMKTLGPEGSRAMASSMASWAKQMEIANPKLRAPLENLMNGITDDLNRLDHTTGSSMKDLQDKVFYFNGQIYTGASAAWSSITGEIENKNQVMLAKLTGIWGQIVTEAMRALTGLGFSQSQAQQIFKDTQGNATQKTMANVAVQNRMQGGAAYSPTFLFSPGSRRARGGVIQGAGLMDTVPMPDGGLAAPGEAWIANRHTMMELDAAAIEKYGKTAWQMIRDEERVHSAPPIANRVFNYNRHARGAAYRAALGMVGGAGRVAAPSTATTGATSGTGGTGYVYPFPGMSPGRVDQGYDLSGAGPLYAMGAGRVIESGLWPGWPGTGGVVYQLTSGPRAGANVYYMEHVQSNVSVGQSVQAGQPIATLMSGYPNLEAGWANASGTGPLTPYNGAADGTPMPGGANFQAFVNALQSGGKLPAGMAGGRFGFSTPQIGPLGVPKSHLGGLPGVMDDTIANAWSRAVRQKVNQRLQSMAPMMGGSTAGLSGGLVAIVNQIARQRGWTGQVQDWLNVIQRESGGSMTVRNPSSGAYGIAQGITGPSWYYTYGGDPNTMGGQLLAMANYMGGRYGGPAGAWAHETSAGWYARGGKARWGGWNDRGGDYVTQGPTLIGAGERRKERVTITPLTRGGASSRAGGGVHVHFHGPIHLRNRQDIEDIGQFVGEKVLAALGSTAQDGADNDLIEAPA